MPKQTQIDNPTLAYGQTNAAFPATDAYLSTFVNLSNRGRVLASATVTATAANASTIAISTNQSDGVFTAADSGQPVSIAGAGLNGYPFNSVMTTASSTGATIPHAVPTTVSGVNVTIGTIMPGMVVAWDTGTATSATWASSTNSLGRAVRPATSTVAVTATDAADILLGVAVTPIPPAAFITTPNRPSPVIQANYGDVCINGPILSVKQPGGGTASAVALNVPIKVVATAASTFNPGNTLTNDTGAMLALVGTGGTLGAQQGVRDVARLLSTSTTASGTGFVTGSVIVINQ